MNLKASLLEEGLREVIKHTYSEVNPMSPTFILPQGRKPQNPYNILTLIKPVDGK